MTEATEELKLTHGIEVGMGSIFGKGRLWPDVSAFQVDLLRAAIDDRSFGGANDPSLALIEDLPDVSDRPVEDRIEMLVDLCRIAGMNNGYARPEVVKTGTWQLWVGIWSLAMADEEVHDSLIEPLRLEEYRSNESFTTLYRVMLDKLGLRLKPEYTLEQMASLAASLTDGIALRSSIVPEMIDRAESHHGGTEWNLLGVGLAAIALEVIDQDGDPARPTGGDE